MTVNLNLFPRMLYPKIGNGMKINGTK